jgi:hypothetical protein
MKRILPWLALYAALAGAYDVALRSYGPPVALKGALGGAFGLLLTIGAARSAVKARGDVNLVRAALGGAQPADGRRSAVLGSLVAAGPLLTSPFSHQECLGYRYQISHVETTIDNDGSASSSERNDFSGSACSPLTVRTRNAEVRLAAPLIWIRELAMHPLGEPAQFANAEAFVRQTSFTTSSLHQMVDILREAVQHPFALFDAGRIDMKSSTADLSIDPRKQRLQEGTLPAGERVCAIGCYSAAKGELGLDGARGTKLLRGRILAGSGSESRQKLGGALFFLLASHIVLFLWLAAQGHAAR